MPDRATLTAADVMTPAPRTCSTSSTVLEAVRIFRDADCGAVPVLEDGKPAGVLTDRDVALALPDFQDALPGLPVGRIMSQGVVAVTPESTLDSIAEQLADHRLRRLLVVDSQGSLVGIIGWADIAAHIPDPRVGEVVSEVVQRP